MNPSFSAFFRLMALYEITFESHQCASSTDHPLLVFAT